MSKNKIKPVLPQINTFCVISNKSAREIQGHSGISESLISQKNGKLLILQNGQKHLFEESLSQTVRVIALNHLQRLNTIQFTNVIIDALLAVDEHDNSSPKLHYFIQITNFSVKMTLFLRQKFNFVVRIF